MISLENQNLLWKNWSLKTIYKKKQVKNIFFLKKKNKNTDAKARKNSKKGKGNGIDTAQQNYSLEDLLKFKAVDF